MPLTSLGRVSNSSSRAFTNAKGTIANVNYGRIVGSYDNFDVAYNTAQTQKKATTTVNFAVTQNQPCNNLYNDGMCIRK
jgi:hypothetical protein